MSTSVQNGDALLAQLNAAMQPGYVAAFRILGNADQARDACQEAAARALSARDRYDTAQPFYPWFYRILKNHCIDRIKGRKRMVPTDAPATTPDDSRVAERKLIVDERQKAVAAAIEELPEAMREVIELRHFQDLSYDEMAAVLGCPVGTVMSRLYRARKQVREILLRAPGFAGHTSGRTSPRGEA